MIDLIQKLPQGYRTVFNMYVIDGYSHKEISEVLSISESTSKSQLFKARKQLQIKLKGWFE
jgi:RNA polymerase sigma-70 factor (ECF subfamily)